MLGSSRILNVYKREFANSNVLHVSGTVSSTAKVLTVSETACQYRNVQTSFVKFEGLDDSRTAISNANVLNIY